MATSDKMGLIFFEVSYFCVSLE